MDEPSKLNEDRLAAALAAQNGRVQPLPRRFFTTASVRHDDAGSVVLLDGRPARTPARKTLALPSVDAAEALAREWNALGDVIDPAQLPLTRVVNSAIDGVVDRVSAVSEEVMAYVASDLLLYRAAAPERLVEMQAAAWDPVLDLFRTEYGARFVLADTVMPVEQPPATLSLMRQVFAEAVGQDQAAPFRLASLNAMTTLTGSALLALAVLQDHLEARTAWSAAHVDEHFQESQWGTDSEALIRRERRWQEMLAAATLGRLLPASM